MAQFAYRGRDASGKPAAGVLEADSAASVARLLQARGIVPVAIAAAAEGKEASKKSSLLNLEIGGAPSPDDLMFLCRQMHTLTRSGVPLTRGMSGLAESSRNAKLAYALRAIIRGVESGHPLSQSFGQHGDIFSPLFVAILLVGESSGRLDDSFRQLAFYLERERDTRNQVKAAMRYPIMVLAAIAVAIAIVNLFVIPTFAKVFAGFGVELPWATRILLGVSAATVAYWPYVVGVLVVAVWAWRRYIDSPGGRLFWDRIKLRLPAVGPVLSKATLGRFARAFAVMFHSGLPLTQSLTLLSGVVDNAYIGGLILNMRRDIERGDSITRSAAAIGQFPPLVLQMLETGEETGQMEEMLNEVATYYEGEVQMDLKNLSSAIEPILLVVVGIMVLILALGVFLPMWNLGQAAMGRH